jgi:hypothetical protein
MPRLLLFAPCERVIVEEGANTVSLIALLHGLTVHSHDVPEDAVAPQVWYAISIWHQLETDGDQTFQQRIRLTSPVGEDLAQSISDFTMNKPFQRNVVRFPLLPIGRRGSHELRLELKDPRDERWSEVGSYPFTIDHLVSALPPTP